MNTLRVTILSGVLLTVLSGCQTFTPLQPAIAIGNLHRHHIVVAPNALPSERYAAEELQRLYQRATGKTLAINNAAEPGRPHILIGPDAVRFARKSAIDHANFGPETLRIVADRDEILITGGRPRGTLYGVYTFCEKALGVRFLTAKHTHVPKLEMAATIPAFEHQYSPPITWRYTYYGEIHEDHAFAVRLRQNALRFKTEKLGGRTAQRLFNHSSSRLLPWKDYGKTNPEYFSLQDGKRPIGVVRSQSAELQPCFSHPGARQAMIDNLLKQIKKYYPGQKEFSVSQGDNNRYCTCAACAAKDAAAGSHTGQLLDFVNAAAAAVEKQYPDVIIGTLIYRWSRTPPKNMRPRHNVRLQLCTIECCQIHPIADPNCPLNVEFQKDLAGWQALTDKIGIWHYNVNFRNYLVPCPNLYNLEANVRNFVDNGVERIFMQCAAGTTGAEFSDLRNYVIGQLLWDPTRDGEQLIDEFLTLHYGKAATPIRAFIDAVHQQAQASGKHHDCYGVARNYGLDAELGAAGLAYFEQALALAETAEERVRVEKLSVAAWRLTLAPISNALLDGGQLTASQKQTLRPKAAKFFALCRQHNIRLFTERLKIEDAEASINAMLGDSPEPTDSLQPFGKAVQGILDLYQKRDLAFQLRINLETKPQSQEATRTEIELTSTRPGRFEFRINHLGEDIRIRRDTNVCVLQLPSHPPIIGNGPLPAGASEFGLEGVLRELAKGNPTLTALAPAAKGITGQAALVLPKAVGMSISPSSVEQGQQRFTLKTRHRELAEFVVDRASGQLVKGIYHNPEATIAAKFEIQHGASLPAPSAFPNDAINVPRADLEAALLQVCAEQLGASGKQLIDFKAPEAPASLSLVARKLMDTLPQP